MEQFMGMMGGMGMGVGIPFGIHFGVLLLALWSIVWKGLALWHAARRGEEWWFVGLLVINTLGILEIVYLFAVVKLKPEQLFRKK